MKFFFALSSETILISMNSKYVKLLIKSLLSKSVERIHSFTKKIFNVRNAIGHVKVAIWNMRAKAET